MTPVHSTATNSTDDSFVRTSCPQCGGTAREVPGRRYLQCRYCHSLVFPEHSPLETDGIVPTGAELASGCPCCQNPMQTGEIDGHRVVFCRRCYGILIGNASFAQVLRTRRAARSSQETIEVQPIDPTQYERKLSCPSCQLAMEVHPYYGPGNVVIDSCSTCNYIWLDHGELARLERVAGRAEPAPAALPGPDDFPAVPRQESTAETLLDLFF